MIYIIFAQFNINRWTISQFWQLHWAYHLIHLPFHLSLGVVRNKILFWQAAEVATLLALFQGGLTILGYFLGSIISDALKATDHWVALLLLSFLGAKMIIEGKKKSENESVSKDFSSRLVLLTIALGTSIDAFAVGISFAILSCSDLESRNSDWDGDISCINDCNKNRKISRRKTGQQG